MTKFSRIECRQRRAAPRRGRAGLGIGQASSSASIDAGSRWHRRWPSATTASRRTCGSLFGVVGRSAASGAAAAASPIRPSARTASIAAARSPLVTSGTSSGTADAILQRAEPLRPRTPACRAAESFASASSAGSARGSSSRCSAKATGHHRDARLSRRRRARRPPARRTPSGATSAKTPSRTAAAGDIASRVVVFAGRLATSAPACTTCATIRPIGVGRRRVADEAQRFGRARPARAASDRRAPPPADRARAGRRAGRARTPPSAALRDPDRASSADERRHAVARARRVRSRAPRGDARALPCPTAAARGPAAGGGGATTAGAFRPRPARAARRRRRRRIAQHALVLEAEDPRHLLLEGRARRRGGRRRRAGARGRGRAPASARAIDANHRSLSDTRRRIARGRRCATVLQRRPHRRAASDDRHADAGARRHARSCRRRPRRSAARSDRGRSSAGWRRRRPAARSWRAMDRWMLARGRCPTRACRRARRACLRGAQVVQADRLAEAADAPRLDVDDPAGAGGDRVLGEPHGRDRLVEADRRRQLAAAARRDPPCRRSRAAARSSSGRTRRAAPGGARRASV